MPKSVASHRSRASVRDEYQHDGEEQVINENVAEAIRNAYRNSFPRSAEPPSPVNNRFMISSRSSNLESSQSRLSSSRPPDERTALLSSQDLSRPSLYHSVPGTPRPGFSRAHSYINSVRSASRRSGRGASRRGSNARASARPLVADLAASFLSEGDTGRASRLLDNRVWYDQFTSTDWVRDSIADAFRVKELRARRDFRGRIQAFFDGAHGWLLVAVIGCLTAGFAYVIDVSEASIFDLKTGYCSNHWFYSKQQCCSGGSVCHEWRRWSTLFSVSGKESVWIDYAAFVLWAMFLALLSCLVTLQTRTEVSSAVALSTLDENLGAERQEPSSLAKEHDARDASPTHRFLEASKRPPVVYYPAAGSGVAEVRVILSGFVLHGYLGLRTLILKAIGLVLSVASGLSIGKEGPFVHIATCLGNITSRLSKKYRENDAKRRELLSASAAAGVAVAFGSPIGGVLFSLEEVSYYFPPKTLFRTLFCCISAALSLKFLNPYGTNKIVLFEVRYNVDWKFFEIFAFIMLGVLGGALGALFIKASRVWAQSFRRVGLIKRHPVAEVLIMAAVTGLVTYWNRYTRLPVAELLYELAAPCTAFTDDGPGLCPTPEDTPRIIKLLLAAFVVKAILTTVTFGIKVPAGIYVPSMVVGGLLGRIVGHSVQLLILKYPESALFASCPANGGPESCVVPGVYALVAAGATMCGVTRLSVTLAVILFELTGSLEHVLPFSLAVLVAKWTSDALEPLSLYDMLTEMNSYPFLDAKTKPVFDADLGDITPAPSANRYIDISDSFYVPASELRSKLDYMHMAGEIDGGLPIVRDGVLVGLIAGPDLEFALDQLEQEDDALCLMHTTDRWEQQERRSRRTFPGLSSPHALLDDRGEQGSEPDDETADFTRYIDPAPVALDIGSPMDLVFECFVKLGLRFVCVLQEGKYAGLVHKKRFVHYVKELEDRERKGHKTR